MMATQPCTPLCVVLVLMVSASVSTVTGAALPSTRDATTTSSSTGSNTVKTEMNETLQISGTVAFGTLDDRLSADPSTFHGSGTPLVPMLIAVVVLLVVLLAMAVVWAWRHRRFQ